MDYMVTKILFSSTIFKFTHIYQHLMFFFVDAFTSSEWPLQLFLAGVLETTRRRRPMQMTAPMATGMEMKEEIRLRWSRV